MSELKIKSCPFCGGEMKFHRGSFINKYGQTVINQYYQHEYMEQDCIFVLDKFDMLFTIPAGDANEETGYIGYYAEKWNQRVEDGEEMSELKIEPGEVLVRHGKWIGCRYNEWNNNEYEEKCSSCGRYSTEYGKSFCPNCGAKMDKE